MTSAASSADASVRPFRSGNAGRFELQLAESRLPVNGAPAAQGDRSLDLLMALAARLAQLMRTNELLDIVCPGLVVKDNHLRVQIKALRQVRGDALAPS